ncbi:MAG: glycosyltransferase family 2 protein [Bacteroidota bacterium]
MSVSVIIPTLNRLDLLKVTLENILKQTTRASEIIVVDSGSTDGTQQYLREHYSDSVILVPNPGRTPGAARNAGFRISTGKYIQFMDSDDVVTNNKFRVQMKVLRDRSAGAVYGPYVHASWDGQTWIQQDVILQYRPLPSRWTLHRAMVRGFFTIIPGFLFDRHFLKELGPWREDQVAYEDWDYLWRMGQLCPAIPHTSECCYFYRIHGNQTTGAAFSNSQRDRQKLEVFGELWNNFISDSDELSRAEKLFFKAQIYHTMIQGKNRELDPEMFDSVSSPDVILADLYLRLVSKVNRLRTGSGWQLMHGVNTDPEQFRKYLGMI